MRTRKAARRDPRRTVLAIVVIIVVGALLLSLVLRPSTTSRPSTVTGTGAGAPTSADASGDTPGDSKGTAGLAASDTSAAIEIGLVLRRPEQASVDAYLASLDDPASAAYHHYLTPQQFGMRFGPDDASIARVEAWLRDAGFRAGEVEPQRTLLRASGTVGQANRAFGVTLLDDRTGDGTRFHVADRSPSIPAAIRDVVFGVTGLDERPSVHPLIRPPVLGDVRPGGMLPPDLRRAYDMESLANAGIDGTGQTVAVVSFDSFADSDLAFWEAAVGTTGPPVERVLVAGPVAVGNGTKEVMLDLETLRSVAPQATLIDYEVPLVGGRFADVMSRILADGRADIVSISWGQCETHYDPTVRQAADQEFQAAYAAGITIYVASGDLGAYDCNGATFEGDLSVTVDYPSGSPYLVPVGGTLLSVREDGTYYREAAWQSALNGAGTGGGESQFYPRPEWQVAPGVDETRPGRLVPDVAGPGDPWSGIYMLYTSPGASQPTVTTGGGTSQAAPFWAGVTALIRQAAQQEGVLPQVGGHARIGALAPTFYALAAGTPNGPVFHDITSGTNLLDAASVGWDKATGLGTPIVSSLTKAILERFAAGTP